MARKRPISIGSERFKRLQAKWYDKLKTDGFVDVEKGRDLNMMPASTLPGGHQTIHMEYSDQEPDENQDLAEETHCLVNDDRAVFWRQVQDKIRAMVDEPAPGVRQFLTDWAESGNLVDTARDYGYTRNQAQYIVGSFMRDAGLVPGKGRAESRDLDEPEPGPVRVLSRAEIAQLKYRCPKQIKDETDA